MKSRPITASQVAERYGFTSRHWIRMAAEGKAPGAFQPSGPGGRWMFDPDELAAWWETKRAKPDNWRPTHSPRRQTPPISVERKDLKSSLAKVLRDHPSAGEESARRIKALLKKE